MGALGDLVVDNIVDTRRVNFKPIINNNQRFEGDREYCISSDSMLLVSNNL